MFIFAVRGAAGGKLHIIEVPNIISGMYILAILSKLKNREEFEGGLEKKARKRGEKKKKKKRVIKHTLKYLYEA